MHKQFEKISKDSFIDELQKIAQNPFDYENNLAQLYNSEEELPEEEYEEQPDYTTPTLAGSGIGAAALAGIGALGNSIYGNPISRNLLRNSIIGGLLGAGAGFGLPILMNRFSSNDDENNIAAEPINPMLEE
jgi:hypothetical protein